MNSEFDSTELQRLFTELCDNSISQEQHERLQGILQKDSKARQQWFLLSDIEAGLHDWATTENERRFNDFQGSLPKGGRRLPFNLGLVAIAAALLLTLSIAFWPKESDSIEATPPETLVRDVAVLTHAVDVVWQDERMPPSMGSTLSPAVLRLRSGALLIEFFSGAKVVLEGPSEFEILSKNAGHLIAGKLNAHVPPQAHGFTIKTTAGEIVDHGTDFGLNMISEKPHELHVFSGEVEVKTGGDSLNVMTGEAIRLGAANDKTVFDADRSAFLAEKEVVDQSKSASKRRLEHWRAASNALSNDPATLYHLRLDRSNNGSDRERALINSASQSSTRSGGNLLGGQSVAGRWHGKQGLLFGGPADRVRLTIPKPMKAVTLLAWVNVQSLSRWQNSLLSADSDIQGSIHWQLTKRGQLRLAIARDLGGERPDWEAIESQPFLTEEKYRQWFLLATTFDGNTIRHYSNGSLVGEGASFTPEAVHIGTAEIGNWLGETRRELNAVVDELVILSRVLEEDEISEIHRYGKP